MPYRSQNAPDIISVSQMQVNFCIRSSAFLLVYQVYKIKDLTKAYKSPEFFVQVLKVTQRVSAMGFPLHRALFGDSKSSLKTMDKIGFATQPLCVGGMKDRPFIQIWKFGTLGLSFSHLLRCHGSCC